MSNFNPKNAPRYSWFVVESKEEFEKAVNFEGYYGLSINEYAGQMYEILEKKVDDSGAEILKLISKTSRNFEHSGELSQLELNTIICSFFYYYSESEMNSDSKLIKLFQVLQLIRLRSDINKIQARSQDVNKTNRLMDILVQELGYEEIGLRFNKSWLLTPKETDAETVKNSNDDYITESKGSKIVCYEKFNLRKNDLNVDSIMGEFLRGALYNRNLFYDHDIYRKIKRSIFNTNVTFIIGNPLSGKTRIAFDSFSEMQHGLLIKVFPTERIQQYTLPRHQNMIVFFDDIDDHFRKNANATNRILSFVIKNKIKCIITCRTGPEYDVVQTSMSVKLFEVLRFNRFTIPRFEKNDPSVQSFLDKNKDKFNTGLNFFDGNFGSVILNLEEMRRRYQLLKSTNKDLSIAILIGLKLHYHYHNFEINKSTYSESKIRVFCEKYLDKPFSQGEWEKAKLEIESSDTSLNFITQKDFIYTEEAYLDFLKDSRGQTADVISDYNKYKIKSLLSSLYRIPSEKRKLGFPGHINDYNGLIFNAKSYVIGKRLFDEIPPEVEKNANTYIGLMKLTRDKSKLENIYFIMKKQQFDMRFFPLHVFIGQFDSFEDLLSSLRRTERTILSTTNSVTNKLISLAELDPKKNLALLFKEFSANQIFKNPAFNKLVNHLVQDNDDFDSYLRSFIDNLKTLDYGFKYNFIRTILKLGKYQLAEKLLEIHVKNESEYDYLNEKANIETRKSVTDGLKLHHNALSVAKNSNQKLKSYSNICQIFCNNNELPVPENFLLSVHSYLNKNIDIIKHAKGLVFLIQNLLQLELMNITEPFELLKKISTLNGLEYISNKSIKRVKEKLNNTGKTTITLYFSEEYRNGILDENSIKGIFTSQKLDD